MARACCRFLGQVGGARGCPHLGNDDPGRRLNIGVAAAYGDWSDALGAALQLGLNLGGIVLAGVLTLFVQRRWYVIRRRKHLATRRVARPGCPWATVRARRTEARARARLERGPDVDLRAHPADHLVGELGRARVPAQVGRADACCGWPRVPTRRRRA